MRNIFYILFLFSIAFSCRKEKLKDEEEKLLVGNWKLYIGCSEQIGCVFVTVKNRLQVNKKGLMEYEQEYEEKIEKARIIELELLDDPLNRPPQISYLFKATIKKRNLFSIAPKLESFNYIRWMNGYFNAANNFVEVEMINFTNKDDFETIGDLFFIRG